MSQSIKIESAALDDKGDHITLRGMLLPESLRHLGVDDYQREVLNPRQRASILDAIEKGQPLADIVLGMRGDRHTVTRGVFDLRSKVFIIDGQQRCQSIIEYLAAHPDRMFRIGAVVHFNTTKEFEKEQFHVLNARRLKLAPSVLLRNAKDSSNGVSALYALTTNDRAFVMHDRVCWQQNKQRNDLVTAQTFARIATVLFSHQVRTEGRPNVDAMVYSLDRIVEKVGVQALRDNIRTFWGLVDECWNIRRVMHVGGAPHLKGPFLEMFAKFLSDHHDFWTGDAEKKLFVDAPLRRKIGSFSVHDPVVVNLAGSGGKAKEHLYQLLRDHVNSGKRTKHLRSRLGDRITFEEEGDDGETSAAA